MKNKYILGLASILLSSDSGLSAGDVDPLDMGAESIDLSRPIAPASNYPLSIKEATKQPNKKNTGENLVLKWVSTTDISSTKGDVIPAGRLVMTQYMGLTPSDKRSAKDIGQDIARLIRGGRLPGSTTPRDVINNPSLLVSKTLLVKVSVRTETAEFPESNEVKSIVLEG